MVINGSYNKVLTPVFEKQVKFTEKTTKLKNVTQSIGTKIMNKSYFVLGKTLITLLTIMAANSALAVSVSFNNSAALDMFEEVNYNLAGNEIEFFVNDPIICHTSSGLVVNGLAAIVTDANDGPGVALPVTQSVQYDVPNQIIHTGVNSGQAACATKTSGFFSDVIFATGFEAGIAFTVEYVNVPNLVVLGQPVDYEIIVQNNSSIALEFDLLEYVSESSLQNDAFYSNSTVSWDCINQSLPNVDCGQNIANRYGARNVVLQAGEFAQFSISRTVSSQSLLDENISMLAAVFVKNQSNDFVAIETIDKEVMVSENEAPELSWLNNSINTFLEDDQTGQVLSFRIEDESGANFSANYVEQTILSYNDKVDFSNVSVQQSSPGIYDVTFTVTPQPDKFTDSQNTEFISIQVSDIFNVFSNTLILEVDIMPVNDAPSFGVSCTHLVLDPTPLAGDSEVSCSALVSGSTQAPTSSVYTWDDFLVGVSAGPYENQSLSFEIAPGATGDPIIDYLIIGSNVSDLWLLMQDGSSGSATVNLIATDDGDLLNGGQNQFQLNTDITIELLPVTYTVSGLVNNFPTVDPASDITLRLSVGGDILDLEVDATNASGFTFGYQLVDGASYSIQIIGQTLASCSISAGGSGTISGNDISDLVIDCVP